MVIKEGCTVYLSVLAALGFTVDTVYYGGKKLEYERLFMEVSSCALFLS